MARHPSQGRSFERRNGAEGFVWEGIATKVDPAGNPPNRPRDLVNIRIQGGVLISRPGFQGEGGYIPLCPIHNVNGGSDLDESPPFDVSDVVRWVPHWLGEHNSAAGVRLWLVAETTTANGYGYLMFGDPDSDLGFQVVATLRQAVANQSIPIEKFNNEIYYGDHGGLRKLYLIPSPEGALTPPISTDVLADEVIISYPEYMTGALQEHAGLLFFAATGGPSFGTIYSWDGLGVTQEFVMAIVAAGAVMTTYRDTLVVSVRDYAGAGQGSLLVRDATGAWTAHTLAGFQPSSRMNSMSEYGDLLYIMDGVNKIYTWDGANIALGRTLPAGAAGAHCCAKLSGRLYYGWSDVTGGISQLGYVDKDNGAAQRYTDAGTRLGIVAYTAGAHIDAMAQYRGRLWLSILNGGTQTIYWHSKQFMPFDGWQNSNDATRSFTTGVVTVGRVSNMRTL